MKLVHIDSQHKSQHLYCGFAPHIFQAYYVLHYFTFFPVYGVYQEMICERWFNFSTEPILCVNIRVEWMNEQTNDWAEWIRSTNRAGVFMVSQIVASPLSSALFGSRLLCNNNRGNGTRAFQCKTKLHCIRLSNENPCAINSFHAFPLEAHSKLSVALLLLLLLNGIHR